MIIKMAVWSSRLVVERSRSISRRGGFSLFQTFGTFRFLDGRSKCATESYTHTHTHAHTLKGAERIEEETSERCLAKVCHHSTLFFSLNKTKNGHWNAKTMNSIRFSFRFVFPVLRKIHNIKSYGNRIESRCHQDWPGYQKIWTYVTC